ncbi:MAG: hypothetical protein HKM93_18820 [Desulfobacteraceae bacterium]|nr:hypothetical protein [Desulfobacteraceae bacterium]
MAKSSSDTAKRFISKKCPNCFTYMPLKAKECTACHAKLGDVDRFGMASKPTNWHGYFVAIAAWLVFMLYVWWAFLKE